MIDIILYKLVMLSNVYRYNDYSLPGGGVDENESLSDGFKRELSEETGAQGICNIKDFGIYEEYRPHNNTNFFPECSIMHMLSYCYTCDISEKLGETRLEDYEVKNGMQVSWIKIDDAIEHNLETIKNDKKQGLSIQRETYLLQEIKTTLINGALLNKKNNSQFVINK